MKKRFLLKFLIITLSLLAGAMTVGAETDGIYTYSTSDVSAIITACDSTASGSITIP